MFKSQKIPCMPKFQALNWMRYLLTFPLFLFAAACEPVVDREDYIPAYQVGQIQLAENILNQRIKKRIPDNQFEKCKDSVPLLLDKATIQFANGQAHEAVKNYKLAVDAIDYYSQDHFQDIQSQLSLQDDIIPYWGDDFEQLLARIYFSLALMQENDAQNAIALMKAAEKFQQSKKSSYSKCELRQNFDLVENPLAKYLLAVLLEHAQDPTNAEILYNQTEKLIDNKLSYFGLHNSKDEENNATVLVIVHNGNAPYKISKLTNSSVASTAALELMLGKNCPAVLSFTGIKTPQLMQKVFSNSFPVNLRICRKQKTAIPLFDVSQTAAIQLENNLPFIAAKGLAKMAMRRSIIAGLNEQSDQTYTQADVGMSIANSCFEADTRSWRTLPNSIDVARFDIPAGNHTLHVLTSCGATTTFAGEKQLKLKENDLCVVNIFNIHPGVVSIQVPDYYKNNNSHLLEEDCR